MLIYNVKYCNFIYDIIFRGLILTIMDNNITGIECKKSFLTLRDFSREAIESLVDFSIELKASKVKKEHRHHLKNKNIALIFEKNSTRTRCALEIACLDEGANAIFLDKNAIQMGDKESVKDTARVLGRMFDAICFRGYKNDTLNTLYKYSNIPVINALTDDEHPTQIIADFMTIKERFGRLSELKLVYVGDGRNNVANTLLIAGPKVALNVTICSPNTLFPNVNLLDYSKNIAKNSGSSIEVTDSIDDAIKGASIVYTDVWVSMGEESKPEIKERIKQLKPYQVNRELMNKANKESIFLHCLPATHKNGIHYMEVTEEVFEASNSLVFEQAENRLHSIKSILVSTVGGVNHL